MRLTEDEGVGSQLLRNQHAAICVLELGLSDRPLFLAGLAYWHADIYHWVTAVVTRDGEILAWDPPGDVEPGNVEDRFAYGQVFDDPGRWLLLPRHRQLQIWNDRWRRRELADHMQRHGAHTSGEFAAGLLMSWLGRDSTRAALYEAQRGDDRPLHEQGPVAQLEDATVLGIVPVEITPTLVAQLENQSPQLVAYVQAFPDQIPPPHRKLPKAAVDLYQEAREVAAASPRSAAALLRVALEALLEELHPSGRSLCRADRRAARRGPADPADPGDGRPAPDRQRGGARRHTSQCRQSRDRPRALPLLDYLAESSETVRRIATSYQSIPEHKRAEAERRRQRRPGGQPPTHPK
jgi:hypothetical protein